MYCLRSNGLFVCLCVHDSRLNGNPYIFEINVIWRASKVLHMATPHPVFISDQKSAKW